MGMEYRGKKTSTQVSLIKAAMCLSQVRVEPVGETETARNEDLGLCFVTVIFIYATIFIYVFDCDTSDDVCASGNTVALTLCVCSCFRWTTVELPVAGGN